MDKVAAIKHLFPNARVFDDFRVANLDGEEDIISEWNLPDPQPTDAELQAAWDDLQINPPPTPETDREKIARLEAENATLKDDGLNTMSGLADTYEQLLALQDELRAKGVIV